MDLEIRRTSNLNEQIHDKSNISNQQFIVHILNNFLEEYSTILDCLKNCFMQSGTNMLAIEAICEKLNHQHKNETKMKRRNKERGISGLQKSFKKRCTKCEKYNHN